MTLETGYYRPDFPTSGLGLTNFKPNVLIRSVKPIEFLQNQMSSLVGINPVAFQLVIRFEVNDKDGTRVQTL